MKAHPGCSYESSVESDRSRLITLPDDAVDDESMLPSPPPPLPAGSNASASDNESEQPPPPSPATDGSFANPAVQASAPAALPGCSSRWKPPVQAEPAVYGTGLAGILLVCTPNTSVVRRYLDLLYIA
jgi:hypothetical protein